MQAYQWHCGRFKLELSQPQIMGIVNATPDSFSDGGLYSKNIGSALKHAEQLLKDGADILDIGGESTRPGSDEVAVEEEWSRLEPVLAELITWNIPLSVDTRRTWVMEKVLENGYADIINDVAALTDEGAVSCLASYQDIGICLMHMQGAPKTMQQNPQYHDVVREVADFLAERVAECSRAGIRKDRIVLDPGFGFGKTLQHNIELMKHLNEFDTLIQLPLLVGVSRKRMIGELTGVENPLERVTGSVAAALAALARGAQVIRVHDVKETVEAVKVWRALGVSV
ncbi:dihydropteroate synthase [Neisseria weaveri]|uniref:Dihydropteroate synthase n=1 Tax=Neisseria weaveri TaxID=28091 RepID=A0A448VHL7_9NEIS|nr:dihydropteroate synthase [Neisseria weaveri]SAY50873.1 dihydropteroate synthase [Neisseria weaveri]VEJ49244.1 dihydropteroate synthase [Neisseria weaveri]